MDYIKKQPDSGRKPAFLQLEVQINQALFNSDMQLVKSTINQIAATCPILASKIYQIVYKETQGENAGLSDLIMRWINEDAYFKPLQGVTINDVEKVEFNFIPTFYIALGEQFDEVKTWLLKEQAHGVLTQTYLNQETKSLYFGYSYSELTDLTGDPNANMVIYLIKEIARNARDPASTESVEVVLLNKFADKEYILKIQNARLLQIEKIYQSNHQTDIAAWDQKYLNNGYDDLRHQIKQQPDIS